MVVVATASPYKFAETVYPAVTGKETAARGLQAIQGLNEFLGEELSPGSRPCLKGTNAQNSGWNQVRWPN